MTQPESVHLSPRQYAEQELNRAQEVLQQAVAIVVPDHPEASPLDVFPSAHELRADDIGLEIDAESEQRLRSAVAELGFGRETNRTMSELGLSGGYAIIEGGQAHKMLAEARLVLEDPASSPRALIISATPYRQIKQAEADVSARVLELPADVIVATEYDVAEQVALRLPGFTSHDEARDLAISYDINADNAVSQTATGQFVELGQIAGVPVVLMRIDRENYTDDEGKAQYRKQPDTAAVIRIVDAALQIRDGDEAPIAFVTSATYQASRTVAAAQAAIASGRNVGVATYGTALLAEVKGENIPAPGPINQLPGELHKMALQVEQLAEVLTSNS